VVVAHCRLSGGNDRCSLPSVGGGHSWPIVVVLQTEMKQKYHNEAAIDSNLRSLVEFGL